MVKGQLGVKGQMGVKAPWGEKGRETGKKGSNLCPPDGHPAVGLSCQRWQRWGPASSALAPPAACGCPSWRSDPPPPSHCPPEGRNTTIISLVQHPPPPSYCPPDGHNNHQSCTTPTSTLLLPSWWTQHNNHQSCTTPTSTLLLPSWWTQHNNHQSCTTPTSTLLLPSWWTQHIH